MLNQSEPNVILTAHATSSMALHGAWVMCTLKIDLTFFIRRKVLR